MFLIDQFFLFKTYTFIVKNIFKIILNVANTNILFIDVLTNLANIVVKNIKILTHIKNYLDKTDRY